MNKYLVAKWGNGVSSFPAVQEEFDEMMIVLLDTFFNNAGENQKEEFIRASFDKIKYLETLLLQQQGVNLSQLKNTKTQADLESTSDELKNIEQSMIIALTRMFRHASIYLPVVNSIVKKKTP